MTSLQVNIFLAESCTYWTTNKDGLTGPSMALKANKDGQQIHSQYITTITNWQAIGQTST